MGIFYPITIPEINDGGEFSLATLSSKVTGVLNSTIHVVKTVVPIDVTIDKPALFTQPLLQSSMGVLIGITGDIRGRLIIEGNPTVFGGVGEIMFGMPLEGEMLESFTGEFGNMIAGNLSTQLSQKGINIDITPPTVLVGQTKIYGFEKAFRVPIQVETMGEMQIILMIEM
ncbi:chemotaxis protein CheX [Cytobacillus sp. Hm23]|uniref:chemotaxis protein CheX n=1 Tax=Cytobacillus sp. IB215665 TaxID=3097357 RepID=UPI002A0CD96C|nr:chemotaxis protein CheX [Cytobacillus sp. IB215665]MDX8366506.1 chemotaxis protein CheX [Cytobacillus sp. IB215665]